MTRYTTQTELPIKIPNEAVIPAYATPGSAAVDLVAVKDTVIKRGEVVPVHTGFHVDMSAKPNLCGLVLPRSGLGAKKGLILANTIGLIDNDYQGEIICFMYYEPRGSDQPETMVIKAGDKFAQLMFVRFEGIAGFQVVNQFASETVRGEGGFGSTG